MSNIPTELRYLKSHEWVRVEGDEVVLGITDHAQKELGDVVYIELPSIGDSFGAEEIFGVVESVKASSDLYTPVGGEVVAINEELTNNPELINKDPYGKGWMVRLKASGEEGSLLSAEEYEQAAGSEKH